MEEKNLTDDEIVKALKFAIAQGEPDGIGFWNNNMKWCEFSMQEILDLIHRLQDEKKDLANQANELANSLANELAEHEEFTKKANAEIERLTEERDTAGYKNNTLIFDKSNLQAKNAELQKQVDELKGKICELVADKCHLVVKEKQAVKDTAKEIWEEIFEVGFFDYGRFSIEETDLDEIFKKRGVEVE